MNEAAKPGEVTRRDLLKKSAVAGGLVWAAPMVLGSTASAQAAACPQGSCPTYHQVKVDSGEQPVSDGGTGVKCNYFSDLAGGASQCPFTVPTGGTLVSTSCTQFNSHVLSVEDGPAGYPGNSIKITLEPGYQFVAGFSKKGGPVNGAQCPGASGATAVVSNSCRTAIFAQNSHIELMYCGPN